MRILGIDPGLCCTGFGIIDFQNREISYVTSGTIIIPKSLKLSERLKVILDNIREIIKINKPDTAALEVIFFNANPSSTLLLCQARGAALCALADCNLQVSEYTALQIKKSVVGYGRAKKEQVQSMIQRLLFLNKLPGPDSADALACAICHGHTNLLTRKFSQNLK